MSTDWKHHVVTVEVIHDEPHVKFECSAPEDALCRTYPDCDCEAFFECGDHGPTEDDGCGLDATEAKEQHDTSGHPYKTGQYCWVQSWFGEDSAIYAGHDGDDRRDDYVPAVARVGEVDVSFVDGEYVEWQWHYPFQVGAS
jgi:hypothetical protein